MPALCQGPPVVLFAIAASNTTYPNWPTKHFFLYAKKGKQKFLLRDNVHQLAGNIDFFHDTLAINLCSDLCVSLGLCNGIVF